MSSDLAFAVIGCGRIGKRHAQLLSDGSISGARLAAVCDVNEARAREFSHLFGVPAFTNMQDMYEQAAFDAACVCTPSGDHAKTAISLAHWGKHVVVEKPMALAIADADEMIEACAENQVKLFVVQQNRFNLPIVKAREAVTQGRLGRMVMGTVRVRWCRDDAYYQQDAWRGTWAHDGGVLANQASHHVDMLEWMMGDVETVYAVAQTALVDVEVEDTAVVILKFSSGAFGVIEATTATRPTDLEGSLSLLGEKGTIVVGGFALNQLETWNFVDTRRDDPEEFAEFSVNPPDVYGFGHRSYLEHAVSCIAGGSEPIVDGPEGRKSLQLIHAIYQSVESGQEVSLRSEPSFSRLGRR